MKNDEMRVYIKPLKQQGFLLLEVLVSLVVFSIGVLGIAGLLMLSNRANNSSYSKQQAVQIIYDMFDRIRANSAAAESGNYNVSNINASGSPTLPSQPGTLCNLSPCTSTQLATYDVWHWLTYDVTKLPRGSGSISTTPTGSVGNTLVTVTVQWDDSLAQSSLGAASTASGVNPNYVQLSIQGAL